MQRTVRCAVAARGRTPARLGLACLAAAALSSGCTLITDVDRSKIPAAEIVPPDPPPPPPADAGDTPPAEGDAGAGDAGATDAGGSSEPAGDAG